jgi:cell division protein FtsZ
MIHFEIPKNQSSIIKVIGVGGGGGNAVNYMYNLGIDGVDFIVCNTDSQALQQSPIPNKIQLGPNLTQGLGAGAKPEIGKQAGEESIEDIKRLLEVNTKMAFVTAGMGGGTGTGAAPIISSVCRSLGILTVGIVTTPFTYEGNKRMKQAQEGIQEMKQHVDTILIISNDKLRQQYGNLPFTQAFAKADNVLATAAKCITDLITVDGRVNLDFNDVQTVMKNGGVAILGNAQASGENRAIQAVEEALSSPLLNDSEIRGAKWILLNITSAIGEHEHTLDELEIIQGYVQKEAGNNCDIILGMGHDPNLEDKIAVTVIATGFNHNEINPEPLKDEAPIQDKIVYDLNVNGASHPAPKPAPEVDAMAPKLVLNEPLHTPHQATSNQVKIDAQPYFSTHINEEKTTNNYFELQLDPNPDAPHAQKVEPTAKAEFAFELVERKESTTSSSNNNSNPAFSLSERELEEKRRFEEQKKAFEDRAARLRQMSFNMKADLNDVENIPAYQRRNIELNEMNNNKSSSSISGFAVNGDSRTSSNLNTINTFLEGNKPD